MSRDPSLPLCDAVVTALRADTAIAAIVGARVYDHVPASADFPYVSLGDVVATTFRADQFHGTDLTLTLHVWSRAPSSAQAKAILDAMRTALDEAALAVTGFRLTSAQVDMTRTFLDVDGKTTHGVLTLRALLEPAS